MDVNMWRVKNKRDGFSLLELLAVMSIAALLTTLAVTSYFSAVRGMSRRSAVNNLANTLIQARQRACMDNASVSVVCYNEVSGAEDDDVRPSFVICKAIGRFSYLIPARSKLFDEFTALDTIFSTSSLGTGYKGAIKLYNLTRGGFCYVYPWVSTYQLPDRYSPYTKSLHQISTYVFNINPNINVRNGGDISSWEVGDSYGIESSPVQSLPRGFLFSELDVNIDKVMFVTFLPDGRATSSTDIEIEEQRPPNKSNTIRVSSNNSPMIKYDDTWQ